VDTFARGAKARGDELRTDFKPDNVDFEEIKSYCNAFPVYLRKSATIIPVLNVARSDKSVGPVSPKPHRCRSCRGQVPSDADVPSNLNHSRALFAGN
jgi:hypothetical protein